MFWKKVMELWPLVNTFIYLRNDCAMAVESEALVGQRENHLTQRLFPKRIQLLLT